MIEIERKFLVKSAQFIESASSKKSICQGYINLDPKRSVRIRIIDNSRSFISIKGKPFCKGLSRFEWEKEIPFEESEKLMLMCLPNKIEKIRYIVHFKGADFEVDVFKGANLGLTVAEIELDDVKGSFEKPKWLGEEVTGIEKYYNQKLCEKPFSQW